MMNRLGSSSVVSNSAMMKKLGSFSVVSVLVIISSIITWFCYGSVCSCILV